MAVRTVQAIINGVTTNLTYNSQTGKYEGNIVAPAKSSYSQPGHYYSVTVKATDTAGNSVSKDASDATLGTSLRLVVKEKVAPVISITYPTASATLTNNQPTITWTVTDNDSGVNPDTIGITINSGNKITGSAIIKSAITGGYSCSYTPTSALPDGSNKIKIDASDNDGNAATQKSVTFKIDTIPPSLSITSPSEGSVTNNPACTVAGTTNDATSSPVSVSIKVNSGAATSATVGSNGAFSKQVTLSEGSNTITITATDSAGKATTITRHVTLDTKAPVIQSVVLTPNPVDAGATMVVSAEVTD